MDLIKYWKYQNIKKIEKKNKMWKMSTYLRAICLASVKRWALSNICSLCPTGGETWTPRWYHRQTDRKNFQDFKNFSCTFICIIHLNLSEMGKHTSLKPLPGRSRETLFFQKLIFVFFELSSIYLFVLLAGLPAQWYHRQTAQGDQKDFQDSQTLATF